MPDAPSSSDKTWRYRFIRPGGDEVYNPDSPDRGTAEILIAKHRNGPVGNVQLAFLDHYTRFGNMARV